MTISLELLQLVRSQDAEPVPESIQALCETLLTRYSDAIQAILFYGSCLRADSDIDGIVDLYLIVDSYTTIYDTRLLAFTNTLLPPNVFYIEVPFHDRIVRAKYAILSLEDFQRSTSMKWFHSYFWARFAQPTKVLYSATPQVEHVIYAALAQSVVTFITRTLPQTPQPFEALTLWETGLSLTYRAELRTEKSGRIAHIVEANRDYYQQTANAVLRRLSPPIIVDPSVQPVRFHTTCSSTSRLINRISWGLRRIQGKVLSILRLIKGLFTFQGGVDYILWKIERHSGVSIELTPQQRQHPLLASPVVFWKLYRKGAFR
ncbi:MAG: hypothetical protein NPIRA04_00260 [Nitrospirales bacterium]|nr:MAG: hypothetical protein NPIRA04_00260 [Nitrospirales bacterium]